MTMPDEQEREVELGFRPRPVPLVEDTVEEPVEEPSEEEEAVEDEAGGVEEVDVADSEETAPAPRASYAPLPILPAVEKATGAAGKVIWGEPKPEPPKTGLEDLFEVPQPEDNDIYTDDLLEAPDEYMPEDDDLSDITRVTNEDIMGRPPKSRRRPPTRPGRPYTPPTSVGGVG